LKKLLVTSGSILGFLPHKGHFILTDIAVPEQQHIFHIHAITEEAQKPKVLCFVLHTSLFHLVLIELFKLLFTSAPSLRFCLLNESAITYPAVGPALLKEYAEVDCFFRLYTESTYGPVIFTCLIPNREKVKATKKRRVYH
jgi:hypothetical protein